MGRKEQQQQFAINWHYICGNLADIFGLRSGRRGGANELYVVWLMRKASAAIWKFVRKRMGGKGAGTSSITFNTYTTYNTVRIIARIASIMGPFPFALTEKQSGGGGKGRSSIPFPTCQMFPLSFSLREKISCMWDKATVAAFPPLPP